MSGALSTRGGASACHTRRIRNEFERQLIRLDEPDVAVVVVIEQRAHVHAGDFARPDYFRVVEIGAVVHPLHVRIVIGRVAHDHQLQSGLGGQLRLRDVRARRARPNRNRRRVDWARTARPAEARARTSEARRRARARVRWASRECATAARAADLARATQWLWRRAARRNAARTRPPRAVRARRLRIASAEISPDDRATPTAARAARRKVPCPQKSY